MTARRTEPSVRSRFAGLHTLPSGRVVYCTHSAVLIGLRYQRPKRDPGMHAERILALMLEGTRPLWATQRLVTAMCTKERRP